MNNEKVLDKFAQPIKVSEVDLVFGGKMRELLPPYDSIPEEFKRRNNKWNKIVFDWFFSGLPKGTTFVPQSGIDLTAALAHIRAILCSFEPKHEHKEAGCAYLLSKWFDDVIIPDSK